MKLRRSFINLRRKLKFFYILAAKLLRSRSKSSIFSRQKLCVLAAKIVRARSKSCAFSQQKLCMLAAKILYTRSKNYVETR